MTQLNKYIHTALGMLLCIPALTLTACQQSSVTNSANIETPNAVNAKPASPSPALYEISDEDTKIYVLGTVHVLPKDLIWFENNLKTAFEASDELVIEMVTPDPQTMQGLVMKLAVDPNGKTLRTYFDEELKQGFEARLSGLGMAPQSLDPFEPWMASVTLSAIQMTTLGLDPESGVEAILTQAAIDAGKPISGLETAEQQLGFMDNLSKDAQLDMLRSGIEDWDESEELLNEMISEWSEGDMNALAELMNEAMEDQPELTKALLTDRNANWANWVKTRLETPGTVFMAVGAGHISGKDSLLDILKKEGIKAKTVGAN